jgi:DNA (cytosine-5)-methyltransferase 1
MIGMTVCSGIGAPEVAAPWIDWRYQSEIEPFPCAVLAHRFPKAVNLGDMTRFQEWLDATFDVLCGGTPCQSFSVAGLRKGLADPRGNLMLTYLAIADRFRPRWIVWENVPGVLSSNGGRDFGAFLGAMGQLGYGFAYRVLDAQYVRTQSHPCAVPQRRRRVFVVGYLGDWRRAAAVLFDGESLSGHSPPRREAGQGVATTLAARTRGGGGLGTDFDCDGGLIANSGQVGYCLTASAQQSLDAETETLIAVAHSLRGDGFDASEDGTGRGTPLVPIAFSAKDYGSDAGDTAPTLRAMGHAASHANGGGQIAIAIQERAVDENPDNGPQGAGYRQDGAAYTLEARNKVQAVAFGLSTQQEPKWAKDVSPTLARFSVSGGEQVTAVAFDLRGREGGAMPEGPHDTANIRAASGGSSRSYIAEPWAVRRLTPLECERLQGFPDGWTDIPYRGKRAADGPRYRALGNSMAVNVMTLIFDRIRATEARR